MFKLSVYLLILVVAVSAYDFQDSDFNEYLFEELQDDYNDLFDGLNRNRRDAEVAAPPKEQKECSGRRDWKKDQCCNGDKINQEQYELYKKVKNECLIKLGNKSTEDTFDPFNCNKMQKVKEQMICTSECVFKTFAIIDENGELQREPLLEQLRAKIGEIQWKKDNVESFVDKCLAEVKEKKAKSVSADATNGCNPCPMEFHHCLWREFSNGCPADLRVDTPKCNKLRERIDKRDGNLLVKHFLHQHNHRSYDD